MCADTLIFNVEIFFKGNLLLLTPIDSAEAAAEAVIHSITAPATAAAATAISIAVATTVTATKATITITIAVRLREEVNEC